jgi:outer membrane receptor for ferrienterochelin and colicins
MKRLVLAFALLLAVAGSAAAQSGSISGSVTDESGAALPGVNISASGPGGARATTTDREGSFGFSALGDGSYQITATLVGFRTASREVAVAAGPTKVGLSLKLALRGEEVVVTASKSESALIDAPATLSVVTAETIGSSAAQNYGDLLRALPGVNVIQNSARDVNVASRETPESPSRGQLALLDGRSIYLDFIGMILWDFVPTNASEIKQIEVLRGPASVVWGANALTGVINVITKTPREMPGTSVTLQSGLFSRDAGTGAGTSAGRSYGAHASYANAPNDRWSYRLSAGYFNSDPLPRPSGTVPEATHPLDASVPTGGAVYPDFKNAGTSQPKLDARADQELASGGRITYGAGFAGTAGIVHTGIGPFDIQSGSHMGYGRVAYQKGGFKLSTFANLVDAKAPNLLSIDATTGNPLQLNFKTQTYDLEIGNSQLLGRHQIVTYGGNARRNNFDLTIAPAAKDRNELGAYVQDEILLNTLRISLGGRVDKFGNIDRAVFSPRVALVWKPAPSHALRVSFNKAFGSPSPINNYLDVATIVDVADLRPLLALFPAQVRPILQPLLSEPLPVVTRTVGNALPQAGEPNGHELREESLKAYEIGYTGTFAARTTLGVAVYQNDRTDNILLVTRPCRKRYTSANPPPGWPQVPAPFAPLLQPALDGAIDALAAQGVCFPAEFTYLGAPIRNRGFETSIDHAFSPWLSAFANYSFQDQPDPRDPEPGGLKYEADEVSIPPRHRLNAGIHVNRGRYLGSLQLNHVSEAFWADVLGPAFAGRTKAYTLVNASFGVRWANGRLTTLLKGTNLLNQDVQQHVFADILKTSIVGEVRFAF